ncbi:MAG: restriction endonuclease subunit S [Acinetobacter calcoaceticus]
MSFPKIRLDQVCRITMGQAPSGDSYNFDGNGLALIAGAGDFGKETPEPKKYTTAAGKKSETGEIILCIRATIGDLNWSDKEYCLGRGVAGLFGHKDKLDQKYLWHWLKNVAPLLKSKGKGATFLQVTKEDICSLEIALPPLSEQRRIASILDQADELRQKRQQSIEKLDQLLQATFIDMFGDPVSNPKGWTLKPIGEISESKLGKMLDKKKQSSEKDQYKYLRNANVQWFKFDLSDVFEMEFNEKDRKNCELKFGDILVCEGGEPGRAAIWKNDLENCFFQKALHRVRLNMNQILPEYFVWLFWFYSKNGGFDDHITVATIAHLTGVKMKAMQIPIPPLLLQEEFQKKVNEIEVLKTKIENSSKLFNTLFTSLQNQAFSGTL